MNQLLVFEPEGRYSAAEALDIIRHSSAHLLAHAVRIGQGAQLKALSITVKLPTK